MKRLIGWTAAMALVFAAQQAKAQASSPLPGRSTPGTTAPAPARSGPAATGAGAQEAVNPGAAETIAKLHDQIVRFTDVADLAERQATTAEVRSYANTAAANGRRLDTELHRIANERGIPLADPQAIIQQPIHQEWLKEYSALTGLEFDRRVMGQLVDNREQIVPFLKQLRDATPGRDAELKKWIDEMEVLAERERNLAREVHQHVRETQQRQGRRPQQ